MSDFIVGGATVNQTPLSWNSNVDNIIRAINQAREESVNLLCLPELCITGYGCEDLFLSAWLSEKAISLLPEIAKATSNIAVAVGLPVRLNNVTYNTTAIIQNQIIRGLVAKQNMAIDGVHYEFRWFTPWKPGIETSIDIDGKKIPFGDLIFDVNGYRVGFEICEDAWRVDRPGINLFKRGVDIILNPSASHFALQKFQEREALVIKSSKEFDCIYVYTNLLGNEAGRMIYDGDIIIADKGKLVTKNKTLSFKRFRVSTYNVSTSKGAISSESWDKNQEFSQSVSLALFDYLRKSKSSGFVLSLSGGADSGSCASLVYEMVKRGTEELGAEVFLQAIHKPEILYKIELLPDEERNKAITGSILTCAYQSTLNSSSATFEAAQKLAENIGASFLHWNIDDIVESFSAKIETALGQKLNWDDDDIVLQNIQARSRSPIIWMLANKKNCLLLVTSNRSEGDVGYATMDGDTSGSIAPLAGIDKHFIRQWLKWAEVNLQIPGLEKTNKLIPTAELRPTSNQQTDEDDLMPYSILVAIEQKAIRDHLSPAQVFDLLTVRKLCSNKKLAAYIIKFFSLWSKNQWKRERTAPSFHLDDFNIDPRTWCRFPILSSNFQEELEELAKQT